MENQDVTKQTIWPIELDENEQKLFNDVKAYHLLDIQAKSNMDFERTHAILQSSAILTESLRRNKKIPASRIKYFKSPDYNIRSPKRSRKEIFENNDIIGEDIYRHPHFIPFLYYFANGAILSEAIKAKADELIVKAHYKDIGCEEFFNFLKSNKLIPKDLQSRNEFSDEVFKLAIDANCDLHTAIRLRNIVKNKR